MKCREVEEIQIRGKPGESEREVFARASLSPLMKAAGAIHEYTISNAEYELSDLIVVLDNQVSKTLGGENLEVAQRILAGQAHTLDAIFNKLAIEASRSFEKNHAFVEVYLKFALRAQSQSRATLLAISEIKNPRQVNVVNQSNISAGHQQVNNYLGESEKTPNELLEWNHERVEYGAPPTASGKHSTVEAVGTVKRANHRARQTQVVD